MKNKNSKLILSFSNKNIILYYIHNLIYLFSIKTLNFDNYNCNYTHEIT